MMEIFLIVVLLFSIIIHEYAHGWVAYKLGDPTPKLSGRLTLNPLAHIDVFGTIMLPILLLLISRGSFAFGYAKPVPINPYNFKNPKKEIMWVGLAGPLSNLILAAIFAILIKLNFPRPFPYDIFIWGLLINLILMIFNILPIPPLDGSRIVTSFLPHKYAYQYLKLEMIGFVLIVILVASGFLRWFIFPLIELIFSLLKIEFPAFLLS
ncbi:MAG: site-2 protease family protein [Candidatus Omnitrophica bacterium]|nr:site-2 protease family protein [Candidatus Omnitrophota bacterium]